MEVKINGAIIKSNLINGVIGTYENFINDIKKADFDKNNIYINNKRLNKEEKLNLYKKISIVDTSIDSNYYSLSVYNYMKMCILNKNLVIKDYRKKIIDSLRIVDLINYENKTINDLSSSEKKLVLFATALLSNPDIIICNELFCFFDIKIRKKIISLFNQLVDNYHKIIVICSNNSEFIYRYTKNLICYSKNKLLIQGSTDILFEENTLKLINNYIDIPKTILFTNLAREKGVKLNYNKDIRDLIKDIYKKV